MNRKDFFRTLIGGAAVGTVVNYVKATQVNTASGATLGEQNCLSGTTTIEEIELLGRYTNLAIAHPELAGQFHRAYPKCNREALTDSELYEYNMTKISDTCKFIQYAGVDAGRKTVNDLKVFKQTIRGKEWAVLTWDCGTAILHLDPKYV